MTFQLSTPFTGNITATVEHVGAVTSNAEWSHRTMRDVEMRLDDGQLLVLPKVVCGKPLRRVFESKKRFTMHLTQTISGKDSVAQVWMAKDEETGEVLADPEFFGLKSEAKIMYWLFPPALLLSLLLSLFTFGVPTLLLLYYFYKYYQGMKPMPGRDVLVAKHADWLRGAF